MSFTSPLSEIPGVYVYLNDAIDEQYIDNE